MQHNAKELMDRLCTLYARLWNVDVRATIADLGGAERFLREPYTMSELIADRLGQGIAGFRGFTEEQARALNAEIPEMFQAMQGASPTIADEFVLNTHSGRAFLQFLLDCVVRLGPDLVAEMAERGVSQDAMANLPAVMMVLGDDKDRMEALTTEARLAAGVEQADHAADRFYLPALQVALQLHRATPGEPLPNAPR